MFIQLDTEYYWIITSCEEDGEENKDNILDQIYKTNVHSFVFLLKIWVSNIGGNWSRRHIQPVYFSGFSAMLDLYIPDLGLVNNNINKKLHIYM